MSSGRAVVTDTAWGGARMLLVSAPTNAALPLDIRKDRPLLAVASAKLEGEGARNRSLVWRSDDLVDEPGRFACNLVLELVRVLGQRHAPPAAKIPGRTRQDLYVESRARIGRHDQGRKAAVAPTGIDYGRPERPADDSRSETRPGFLPTDDHT